MKRLILGTLILLSIGINASANGQSNYEQFSECVAVTSWLMRGRDTVDIDGKKLVQIPQGWKVVGTGVIKEDDPIFFICH